MKRFCGDQVDPVEYNILISKWVINALECVIIPLIRSSSCSIFLPITVRRPSLVVTAAPSTLMDAKSDFSVEISRLFRLNSLHKSLIVGNGSPSFVIHESVDLVGRQACAFGSLIFFVFRLVSSANEAKTKVLYRSPQSLGRETKCRIIHFRLMGITKTEHYTPVEIVITINRVGDAGFEAALCLRVSITWCFPSDPLRDIWTRVC